MATAKAAFCEKDITPPAGVYMTGFEARQKPSERINDPLYLRLLALEDKNGNQSVIVTADICDWPKDFTFRLKRWAREKFQLPENALFLSASLNHNAPLLAAKPAKPEWPVDLSYVEEFEEKVRRGIEQVLGNLNPASIRFGHTTFAIGCPRRMPGETGWRAYIEGYSAPDMPILAIYDETGKCLHGLWYGASCHPTCLTGKDNYYALSAEYPGAIARNLKKLFPDKICPLFSQMCGGDLKARFYDPETRKFRPASFAEVDELGERVANQIAKTLNSPAMRDIDLKISNREKHFGIPFDFSKSPDEALLMDLAMSRGDSGSSPYEKLWAKRLLEQIRTGTIPRQFDMYGQSIRLADDLVFVGVSGGIVSGWQKIIAARYELDKLVFMGYSGFGGIYIPTGEMVRNEAPEVTGCIRWAGTPAPLSEDVEDILLEVVEQLVRTSAKRVFSA